MPRFGCAVLLAASWRPTVAAAADMTQATTAPEGAAANPWKFALP
jgi:hypothetical protein